MQNEICQRPCIKTLKTQLRSADVIKLVSLRRDKYFRLLAEVSIDGEDLGYSLIKNDLARPYDGGKKTG